MVKEQKFLSAIYSNSNGAPLVNREDETKPEPKTYQKLSGLKLSNAHQYIIEHDGKLLYLANSAYVHLLETRLRETISRLNEIQNQVKKLTNLCNKLATEIQVIKQDSEFSSKSVKRFDLF